jgi:hypothetical protein
VNLRIDIRLFLLIITFSALFSLVVLLSLPVFAGDQTISATCSVPKTVTTADGNDAVLDQCYAADFDYGGDTYDVLVYYTEDPTHQNEVGGVEQCTADEAAANFCEHALPDDDVPGGSDNLYAVQVADSAIIALPYYFDRGFPIIDPETFIEIYITEDKDNGWIGAPNILKLDDEYVATTNELKVLANIFHEGQHLIQEKYNDDVGWESWFTEGLARTSQDRTSLDYDVSLSTSYMSNFNDILQDDTTSAAMICSAPATARLPGGPGSWTSTKPMLKRSRASVGRPSKAIMKACPATPMA